MGVAVLWAIFAIVIAVGASSRGRSGFGWFILACVISPLIAGILLLLLPARNTALQIDAKVIDEGRYPCPNCAEAVKIEAKVCIHCGATLDPVAAALAFKEGPVDWLIKNSGMVAGLLLLAIFGYFMATSQPADKAPPTSPSARETASVAEQKFAKDDDDAAVAALIGKDQLRRFKANLKDPIKVAIIECMGVKVYQDPQPDGHPPPQAVCDQINAYTKGRLAQDPNADIALELRDFIMQQLEEQERQRSLEKMRQSLRELPEAQPPADKAPSPSVGDKSSPAEEHQP